MAKKQNTIKIEKSDVINLGYKNNEFYIQDSNTAFLYSKNGKLVKKITLDNNNQSKFYDSEMKYCISKDGKITETTGKSELVNISDKLKKESKIARYGLAPYKSDISIES